MITPWTKVKPRGSKGWRESGRRRDEAAAPGGAAKRDVRASPGRRRRRAPPRCEGIKRKAAAGSRAAERHDLTFPRVAAAAKTTPSQGGRRDASLRPAQCHGRERGLRPQQREASASGRPLQAERTGFPARPACSVRKQRAQGWHEAHVLGQWARLREGSPGGGLGIQF